MKKFFSLFLALAFMLSLISIPVSADGYSLSQTVETVELSNTTLKIKVNVTNNESSRVSFKGYAAVYNAEGEVKGAGSFSTSVSKKVSAIYSITDYEYSLGDYIKTFLWDKNFAPISETTQSLVVTGDTIEGIIIETYLSSPYYRKDNKTVSILVTNSDSEHYKEGEIYKFVAYDTSATNYLGYCVNATIWEDTILECSAIENKNSLLVLPADLIDYIDEEVVIYYETNSSKYSTEIELQHSITAGNIKTDISNYNIVLNGFNSNYYLTEDFFSIVDDLDEITLLDNDNDGAFEFIFAIAPSDNSSEFVVQKIHNDGNLWLFSTRDESIEFEIDTDDDDMYYKIIRDGEEVDASQIAVGDVITVLDEWVDVITVYASSARVEGTVVEIDDDVYTINDTDYKISPLSGIRNINAGTSGVFCINAFGKIAYVELPPLDYEYFYLTDTATEADVFAGNTYLLKGVTSLGEEVTYKLSSRNIDIYTPDGNATKVTAKTAYRYFEEYKGVLKIVLNDNSELFTAVFPDATDEFMTNDRYEDDADYMTSSYHETRMIYGIIALSPDTVIFDINTTEGTVTASTVEKAFTHGSSYSFIAYGEEDEIAPVLVAYDLNAPDIEPEPVIGESEYVFLIDYAQTENSFSETEYCVQILTQDSAVDPYIIASKNVSVYTSDGVKSSLTDKEAYELVSAYVGVAKVAFTEKDNEIAEFYLPGCEDFSENKAYENTTSVYNAESFTLGTAVIDNSTILINIDTTEDDLDASLSAYKAYTVLEDGAQYSFISYGKDGEAADVILAKDLEIFFNAEETVMVVTQVTDTIFNKKDAVKITGVKDGALFSVYVTPEEYEEVKLTAGNVFIYTLEGGYATDIQLLFNSTLDSPGTLSENLNGIITGGFSDDYVTIHYGEITDKTSKTVTLDEDKFYIFDEMNIIVVDYTSATTSISTGTWLSSVKVSNAKFRRTAFIKTIPDMEDEISDIVVFIENAD